MEEEEEFQSLIVGYPDIISYENTQTILEQMERNICKINLGKNRGRGTGFFCEIPFPDENNMLPVFITNNHVINEKLLYEENSTIEVEIKEFGVKTINLNNRMKYTNKDYDITIIEVKDTDVLGNNLELDDNIINNVIKNENKNEKYINKTLYIIQYPGGNLSVSYGTLENIDENKKYTFYHKCSTKPGSSGSPILTLNNKIIGIHRQGLGNNANKGIFLNYPIKEFIEMNFPNYNLIEFNKKYRTQIDNLSIEKLNLETHLIDDKGFAHLTSIKFSNLKELSISKMNATNIKSLERMKLDKLEVLKIFPNRYSDFKINYDISILSNMDLKNLKNLNLTGGGISDINVLEKVNFEKLEKLILFDNKISDINVLEKVNFKELKELDLCWNEIADISVLEKVHFEKLEILNLGRNQITNIDILDNVNFKRLRELYLHINNISNVKKFTKVKFRKLEKLDLDNNKLDFKQIEFIFKNLKSRFS